MAECKDLLLELGSEELPPAALEAMSAALTEGIKAGLDRLGLSFGSVQSFATPRRLAVHVSDIPVRQPDRQTQRRGPAVRIAFDEAGQPTKAALGFARSCGVDVTELERVAQDGAGYLMFNSTQVGEATGALLPDLAQTALDGLPIPKRMRWGDSTVEFARPVHWLVFLYGEEVVQTELLGLPADRVSQGHRFHHPGPIAITDPGSYCATLHDVGWVQADLDIRRHNIRSQVEEVAAELGAKAMIDDALLSEVAALVEWPVALAGSFEEKFLDLPDDLLIASMQSHQKYFPVAGPDGALLPHFITVSNIQSTNPDAVRAGNERVIRPRLSDAAFFFQSDLQTPIAARQQALAGVLFTRKLGSVSEKAQRIAALAQAVVTAEGRGPDEVDLTRRAGEICKFDLMTDMVGEFPELQGIMGSEYARRQGEAAPVADAIAELYRPRYAGDTIPGTPIGQAIAIADKLDTLAGIFGIGQAPTGDKDPFALRRAALGVLRIMIEGELDLDLEQLIEVAVSGYDDAIDATELVSTIMDFMTERLRRYFADRDVPAAVFNAVQARHPRRPHDFARRIAAVNAFRQLPQASSLAAANKRIRNILEKARPEPGDSYASAGSGSLPSTRPIDASLFREETERALAASLGDFGPKVQQMLRGGDYEGAMTLLAGLREEIDQFFDTVKVMDDDPKVRTNRLALLGSIGDLFLHTADISLLQD